MSFIANMAKKLYLAVTDDEYEVIIELADSVSDLAKKLKVSSALIYRGLKARCSTRYTKMKFEVVNLSKVKGKTKKHRKENNNYNFLYNLRKGKNLSQVALKKLLNQNKTFKFHFTEATVSEFEKMKVSKIPQKIIDLYAKVFDISVDFLQTALLG